MTKSIIKGKHRPKRHRRKNKLMRKGRYIRKGTCGGDNYRATEQRLGRRTIRYYFGVSGIGYTGYQTQSSAPQVQYPRERVAGSFLISTRKADPLYDRYFSARELGFMTAEDVTFSGDRECRPLSLDFDGF